MTPADTQAPRLGELLLSAGAISREQLERALAEQSSWGGRLGQVLLALGFIDEQTLALALCRALGLAVVDLETVTVPAEVLHLLPVGVAERYGLLPLEVRDEPKELVVACADPTDEEGQRSARLASGLPLCLRVATASGVERAIRRVYYGEAPGQAPAHDPRFNLTLHALGPEAPRVSLERRVEELERKVEELRGVLAGLLERPPR